MRDLIGLRHIVEEYKKELTALLGNRYYVLDRKRETIYEQIKAYETAMKDIEESGPATDISYQQIDVLQADIGRLKKVKSELGVQMQGEINGGANNFEHKMLEIKIKVLEKFCKTNFDLTLDVKNNEIVCLDSSNRLVYSVSLDVQDSIKLHGEARSVGSKGVSLDPIS